MFKKLDEFLAKKYGGKKFLEIDSTKRNGKELQGILEDFLQALQEYLGATGIYLSAVNSDAGEAFNAFHNSDIPQAMLVYQSVQDKLISKIPASMLRSLNAAIDAEPSDSRNKEQMVNKLDQALHIVLEGLPSEIKEKIDRNIDAYIGKELKPSEKNDDEDDLSG